jgi:hypothetical protein
MSRTRNAPMKSSTSGGAHKRVDRSVAWWSALLLAALVAVLSALFLSARLLLSLADARGPDLSDCSPPAGYILHLLRASDVRPNHAEPSWWHS